MIFIYILVVCLIILVCALIHETQLIRDDIRELEREVTENKLEYKGEIKRLKGKLSFIKYCREDGPIDDDL